MLRTSLAALVLFFLCGTAIAQFDIDSSAKPMVTFSVANMPLVGGTFNVAVTISGVNQLAGFEFDVRYNPNVLTALSCTEGTFLSSYGNTYWMGADIDNSTGVIKEIVCATTRAGGKSGSGALANVTFRAKATGSSFLNIENLFVSDSQGQKILVNITNTSVTVTASPAWDVNRDGRVDIFDFVIVGQHYGQYITGTPSPNPDVNGDGRVTVADLVLVGQHYGDVYWSSAPGLPRAISPAGYEIIYAIREALLESEDPDEKTLLALEGILANRHRIAVAAWGRLKK